jgi:hypothetical protein
MNLTEQKFWKLIKPHLPGDVSRVENATDNGMPDINGTFGIDYWVELKVCNNKSKERPIEKLLRPDQIVWHNRRVKQGACVFVLVRYEDKIAIMYASRQQGEETRYHNLGIMVKSANKFDWPRFSLSIKNVLKHHYMRSSQFL